MSSSICKPSCITGAPPVGYVNNCNITTRQGGISRIVFLVCDPNFPAFPYSGEWTNYRNWIWALCNGRLYMTGPVLGNQDAASFTNKKIDSCGPEQTIAGSQPVIWQDYNADDTNMFDFDFYSFIKNNKRFLKFGYIGCNDLAYMFDGLWNIESSPVIEQDGIAGNTYHQNTVTMSTLESVKPVKAVGLLDALASFSTSTTCYE